MRHLVSMSKGMSDIEDRINTELTKKHSTLWAEWCPLSAFLEKIDHVKVKNLTLFKAATIQSLYFVAHDAAYLQSNLKSW